MIRVISKNKMGIRFIISYDQIKSKRQIRNEFEQTVKIIQPENSKNPKDRKNWITFEPTGM